MPSDDDANDDTLKVLTTTFFPRRRIDDFDSGNSAGAGRRTEDRALLSGVTDGQTGLMIL